MSLTIATKTKAQKRASNDRCIVHLKVVYPTVWGQHVVILGEGPLLSKGYRLACHHVGDELVWQTIISVGYREPMVYKYAIVDDDDVVLLAETLTRRIVFPSQLAEDSVVKIFDVWQDMSDPSGIFARDAFNVMFGRDILPGVHPAAPSSPTTHVTYSASQPDLVVVRFHVWDWQLQPGAVLLVTGSLPSLGGDDHDKALEMVHVEGACYMAEVLLPVSAFPFRYQYAFRAPNGKVHLDDKGSHDVIMVAPSDPLDQPACMIIRNDGFFQHAAPWRGAGVAIPVFSLRSTRSFGVGDFLDVRRLVDVCAAVGLQMVQVLPVNDTSVHMDWRDSYPYSSLSVFALHPLYLAVDDMIDRTAAWGASGDDVALLRESMYSPQRWAFEESYTDVDYEAVMTAKHALAAACFKLVGMTALRQPEFKQWFDDNAHWLRPYAAFCFMRDVLGSSEHWKWGDAGTNPMPFIDRVCNPEGPYFAHVALHYFVQWLLHLQLLSVGRYAKQHRVALKGDLPIGVNKRSVDTWLYPRCFRMDKSTGAPPDYYAVDGQNWGFPTYDWEEMSKDGFHWWRQRLRHMAQYFQAYRIDHVLGFLRIWEIPGDCATGLLGRFRPSEPLWKQELEARGIWDFDRLCEPYVTHKLLRDMFGSMSEEVASRYFVDAHPPRLRFREPYTREIDIVAIEPRPDAPEWMVEETHLKRQGLLTLRRNVVLLRDEEDSDKFYPRFNLHLTQSYHDLNPWWQKELRQLHDDYMYHRQDALWRDHALRTLPPLLSSTNMLVFAEDLGLVPACLPDLMKQVGLIGLRIQRMGGADGAAFGDPATYPYMTVASPSCHDVSNLRAWWEEDKDQQRQPFFSGVLQGEDEAPPTLTPHLARTIIAQHLNSPSVMAIFTLQDLMATNAQYYDRACGEETINDPANSNHYWRYRMHVTLDLLLEDTELLENLRSMLAESGRLHAPIGAANGSLTT